MSYQLNKRQRFDPRRGAYNRNELRNAELARRVRRGGRQLSDWVSPIQGFKNAYSFSSKTASTTKTKSKTDEGGCQHPCPGEVSSSLFRKWKDLSPTMSRLAKDILPFTYYINGANRLAQAPGEQGYTTLYDLYNATALAQIGSQVTPVANNDNIILQRAKVNLKITNQEPGIIFITLHDLTCIQDTVASPTLLLQDVAGDAGASVNAQFLDVSPQSFAVFNKFWKTDKITRVALQPGAVFHHHVTDICNHMYNTSTIKYGAINSAVGYYKKMSKSMIIQYSGAPYNDSTTKTGATVTSGNVTLDYTFAVEYTFKFVQNVSQSGSWGNNLPASFAVSESIENVDVGGAGITRVAAA